MEFIGVAVASLLFEALQLCLLGIIVFCAKRVVLLRRLVCFGSALLVTGFSSKGEVTYLVLLKNTPFLASFELSTLAVVAPLDGVAHGRHAVWLCGFEAAGFARWTEINENYSKQKITVAQIARKKLKVSVRRVL